MRAIGLWVFAIVVGGGACIGRRAAEAADAEVSVTSVPVRYVFVDGDAGKFGAHHWMKAGYTGGLKDLSGHFTLSDGTEISVEGHALIDANDLGTEFSIKKEHLGFFDFDYSEFRKYFATHGGVNRRFSTLQSSDTDKDLRLDIGKFGFETGLTLEDWPEMSFQYEREFKTGAKSRLTWPFAKEVGDAKKIAPSWQEIDETVDSFALKASDEVAGFNLHGEQHWEFVRSETMREESNLATTGVPADTKIRRQYQAPQAIVLTTTLGSERTFFEDKVFVSSGYHFAHLKNREFEDLSEYSQAGVLTNYSYPEQKPENRADSDYDSHTWVQSVLVSPWKSLTFGTKLKSEVVKRHSNSRYQRDFFTTSTSGAATAPNGVIDAADLNLTDTKATRWGEGFSIRFTGIPRSALYTELELEQSRLLLREDRVTTDLLVDANNARNSSNIDDFNRETVTSVRRGTWTAGGRFDPWSFLDLTTQVRRRIHNNDYDDQREGGAGTSSARSAFFDGQSVHTDEFATRVTFKPCRWFKPSFRYQFRADKYATRAESEKIVKTNSLSNIYTFDLMVQPARDLITTASFSRQTAAISTPAQTISSSSGGLPAYNIPTLNADVNTWLLSADYTLKSNIALNGSFQYTRAANFNDDYANTGVPFGADFRQLDLTTGITWSPTDLTSIEAAYGLYTYNPNGNAEVGDYTAHLISFEVSRKF